MYLNYLWIIHLPCSVSDKCCAIGKVFKHNFDKFKVSSNVTISCLQTAHTCSGSLVLSASPNLATLVNCRCLIQRPKALIKYCAFSVRYISRTPFENNHKFMLKTHMFCRKSDHLYLFRQTARLAPGHMCRIPTLLISTLLTINHPLAVQLSTLAWS